MKQLFANNFRTSIASTLSAAGTTLELSDASGAPTPGVDEYFLITLFRIVGGVEQGHEVVKCTSRTGNTLTIEREIEGAVASEFAAGSIAAIRPTAGTYERQVKADANLADLESPSTAFNNIKQSATETTTGVVEKATLAEARAGTANKYPDAAGVFASYNQYGLGGFSTQFGGDIDTLLKTGFYFAGGASTGTKPPQSLLDYGMLLVQEGVSGRAWQTWYDEHGRVIHRAYSPAGSSWRPWQEVHTSGSGATNAETQAGANTEKWISPAALSSRTATETRTGLVELATQAEAEAGVDNVRVLTAQRVRQAVVAWFNGVSGALGRTILSRTTAAQVRSDIGLGTAATRDVGSSGESVATYDATGVWGGFNIHRSGLAIPLTLERPASPVNVGIAFSLSSGTIYLGMGSGTGEDLRVSSEPNLAVGRRVYHSGNILGTVNQSAGVPTGAIIERGSNTNGQYVKYAGGTMICTLRATMESTRTAWGGSTGLYQSANHTWTFPAPFSETPTSVASGTDTGYFCLISAQAVGEGTVNFRSISPSSTAVSNILSFQAIGRWF